jgi:hypothetical protein
VRWARYGAALGGALVGATSWTVWNQSVVNEKVYTVSLLSIAVVMWLVVRWGDDAPGAHRDAGHPHRLHHRAVIHQPHDGRPRAPAVAIYILRTDWQVVTRPWVIGGVVLAVLVGISINYLFLPIRAAQFPPINEGARRLLQPGASGRPNRVQYAKPSVMDRQADLSSQFGNYWQYFSWQFARTRASSGAFRGVFAALGLVGLWELLRKDHRAGLAAAAMLGTLTVALIYYLNFKYGFSMHPSGTSRAGPRARLLLHRLIRLLRRAGVRRARRDDPRPRQPARGTPGRAAPLAGGGAGAADRCHPAAGQPDDGEPRG